MVVISHAARYDRHAAQQAVWGVIAGLAVWATAAIAGLSALLAASETAYDVLRFAGAIYLCCLGCSRCGRPVGTSPKRNPTRSSPRGDLGASVRFTSNLLNPKVGVFYLSFLPQFIPPGGNAVLWGIGLASVHIVTGLVWLTIVARAAGAAKDRFGPRFRRITSGVGGVALLGFGARLALVDH